MSRTEISTDCRTEEALHQLIGVVLLTILTILMGMVLWCILIHQVQVSLPVRVFVTAEQVENHDGIMMLSVLHTDGPPIRFTSDSTFGDTEDAIRGRMYVSSKTQTWEVLPAPGTGDLMLQKDRPLHIYTDCAGIFMTDEIPHSHETSCRMQDGEWMMRITDNTTNELLCSERIAIAGANDSGSGAGRDVKAMNGHGE
ncbi:MAG: hypothetical protein JXA44_04340 [Methanospirillaceae archaeon]|nr:hypothetical protein [Methanospirillaceae archaeon]